MSNRAERRRQGRQEKPAVYQLTQDQIDQIKRDAVKEVVDSLEQAKVEIVQKATRTAFKMLMSIPSMVLHDKFGFGKIRQNRFMHYVTDWYDEVQSGGTPLEEIMAIAEEIHGIHVNDD